MRHYGGFTAVFLAGQFVDDIDEYKNEMLINAVENMKGDGKIYIQFNFSFELLNDINGIELGFEEEETTYVHWILRTFVSLLPLSFILSAGNQLIVLKNEIQKTVKHYMENDGYDRAYQLALDWRYEQAAMKADAQLDEHKERGAL